MNILIVDGNEKAPSDNYVQLGMNTQYDVYYKILQKLANDSLNLTVIHPAISSDFIPKGISLDDFEGIAWTGSLLNIYEATPSIIRQIELAKKLLNKKNSIFGSCWGLQVLVTAAGGKIRKNPNGLEAIIAKNISLNEAGLMHPMYYGKNKIFDSFCWHYDDTKSLPKNTEVLASNQKSNIQSISFQNNQSKIWAVQYHPEFGPQWMAGLMQQREKILLEEEIFKNKNEYDLYKNFFSNIDNESQNNSLNISENITNDDLHSLELVNWINFMKD